MVTTLNELHDMLIALEGFPPCNCPHDCDAMFAARLRRKKQHAQLGIVETTDGAGQLGADHEDWGGY